MFAISPVGSMAKPRSELDGKATQHLEHLGGGTGERLLQVGDLGPGACRIDVARNPRQWIGTRGFLRLSGATRCTEPDAVRPAAWRA